jgi:hypothetical protein
VERDRLAVFLYQFAIASAASAKYLKNPRRRIALSEELQWQKGRMKPALLKLGKKTSE